MSDVPKKSIPGWVKVLITAGVGGAVTVGGQKLAVDSPVHFQTVGQAPADAPEWSCEPEGGIIGAPVVCRYRPSGTSKASNPAP